MIHIAHLQTSLHYVDNNAIANTYQLHKLLRPFIGNAVDAVLNRVPEVFLIHED
jgi:hypothetical protein